MDKSGKTKAKKQKLTSKRSPPKTGLISRLSHSVSTFEDYVRCLSYYDADDNSGERIEERHNLLRIADSQIRSLDKARIKLTTMIGTDQNTNTSPHLIDTQHATKVQNTNAHRLNDQQASASGESDSSQSASDLDSNFRKPAKQYYFDSTKLFENCAKFKARIKQLFVDHNSAADWKYLKDHLLVADETIDRLNTVRKRLDDQIKELLKENTNVSGDSMEVAPTNQNPGSNLDPQSVSHNELNEENSTTEQNPNSTIVSHSDQSNDKNLYSQSIIESTGPLVSSHNDELLDDIADINYDDLENLGSLNSNDGEMPAGAITVITDALLKDAPNQSK